MAENSRIKAERDAAVIPDEIIAAVEELKHAVAYNGHNELLRAGSELWRLWDEWRGLELSEVTEQ